MITSFQGYNHNLIQNTGEFWDTQNISLKQYPILAPRSLASEYKLSQLNNDYIIDNIVKENEFENAFECEKSIVQKGEGKAPVAFADGIALKGRFPQKYKFVNKYGGYTIEEEKTGKAISKIYIRQAYNGNQTYVNKNLVGDAPTVILDYSNQNDMYLSQNSSEGGDNQGKDWCATLGVITEEFFKSEDRNYVEGKTYYKLVGGEYIKYEPTADRPSPSFYPLYEKNSYKIYDVDMLKNFSNQYSSRNNIITSIKINKIHFEKKLRQTTKLKKNGNYYLESQERHIPTWRNLRVPEIDKDVSKEPYKYYEEYDDEGENVSVNALADVLLTFRLKDKDKLCKLRNKKSNAESIMYRGSTVTVTISKTISVDIKFRLKQDPYCTRVGDSAEYVQNTLFTLNKKYAKGDVEGTWGHLNENAYFLMAETDIQEVLSDCNSDIEKAFTEELFAELDKQDVVSLLQKKAEESLTADDLKISTYYDYVQYINPNQEPKDTSVILKNGSVAWSNGKYISYNGVAYSINQSTTQTSPVQLLSMDTKILEFPNNVFLDTVALEKGVQPLGVSLNLINGANGNKPYIVMCDRDGTVLDKVYVGKTEPSDTTTYKYWVDTSQETPYVKVFSIPQGMWVNYNTVYARLYGVDINSVKKGDTVRIILNDKKIDGFDNEYYYIYEIKEDENYKGSIVISQLIPEKKELVQDVVISREIPDFDFVTVASNRVWGCKYGKNKKGEQVNQIYASALGDPTNWNTFQNTSEDSYYLTLGDDMEFTGATSLNGYPYFFKENGIYEVYGSYPASYQLITYEQQGCESGSNKSIAVVDGDIFFKSPTGICVFSNGVVTSINRPLGVGQYHNAIGGGSCGEYYVNMLNENNNPETFVFNTDYSMWIKLNEERYKQFCTNKSGLILAIKSDNTITSFGRTLTNESGTYDGKQESTFEWHAETGKIDFSYPDSKYISNVIIRAIVEADAVLEVYIQYDSNGIWQHAGTLRGNGAPTSSTLNIIPQRCDHYAYKFIGTYGASVISIANEIEQTEG